MRISEIILEAPTDVSRRGFLKGVSSIAAATALPQNKVMQLVKALPKGKVEILGELFQQINPQVLFHVKHELGNLSWAGSHHAISAFSTAEWHALGKLVEPVAAESGIKSTDAVNALTKIATSSSKTTEEYYNIFEHLLGKKLEVRKLEYLLKSYGYTPETFFGDILKNETFDEAFENLANSVMQNYSSEKWFQPITNLRPLPANWANALSQGISRWANKAGQINKFTTPDSMQELPPDQRWKKPEPKPEEPKQIEKPKDDEKITSYGGTATGKFVKPMTAKANYSS